MIQTTFNAGKVKELIKDNGLKRGFVADSLGITAMTLRARLEGRADFTASEISKLADILHTSPHIFFTEAVSSGDNRK